MRVSIIIAVKEDNDFLRECIQKCLKLSYGDYEILVLPDKEISYNEERMRIIPTGPCLPAKKRDMAAGLASGEILAFLDDDAYPGEDWLANAVKNFQDNDVAAVGGPAVTPLNEDFLRRASGHVYESVLVSGNFRYRYLKGNRMPVDDFPSCNLLVRKDIFAQLGGFRTNFWPGEDTILCLEITKRLGKKIIYDPQVLVFHHRRPLFLPHLKQIENYALHRGYFIKRFPENSLKWQYFVPSVFVIWLVLGLCVSLFSLSFFLFYFVSFLAYTILCMINADQEKDFKMTALVSLGIFLTHIYYGVYFLFGLFSSELKEELDS